MPTTFFSLHNLLTILTIPFPFWRGCQFCTLKVEPSVIQTSGLNIPFSGTIFSITGHHFSVTDAVTITICDFISRDSVIRSIPDPFILHLSHLFARSVLSMRCRDISTISAARSVQCVYWLGCFRLCETAVSSSVRGGFFL